MTEFDFFLADRIQKIQSMNELYDLENKAYISFSGGRDSCVLTKLMDLALPNNKIPRVFINTGIEYKPITDFVKAYGEKDERLVIIKPSQNIKTMLEKDGYPFKSKDHSDKVQIYQNSGFTKTVKDYLGQGNKKNFLCPDILRYQFSKDFKLHLSRKCCYRLKKEPAAQWGKENNKPITITGIRTGEGVARQSVKTCAIFYDEDEKELKKFHPLLVVYNDWLTEFIKRYDVQLCELYYPPYNFDRTGCCGCPFSIHLQEELDILEAKLPSEKRKAEVIWQPVYEEYRRIGYRLRPLGLFE